MIFDSEKIFCAEENDDCLALGWERGADDGLPASVGILCSGNFSCITLDHEGLKTLRDAIDKAIKDNQ